ncbi:hypothetical protein I79_015531 [Cricetulus griseus]|uniref:Uncharacterized protein n=1 Tax=Cricetulus griseus TaxID=10029 RepID=G3HX16_CRIGR|nr:hypothetical protein I79_015531 [Cricetulus griseus]
MEKPGAFFPLLPPPPPPRALILLENRKQKQQGWGTNERARVAASEQHTLQPARTAQQRSTTVRCD